MERCQLTHKEAEHRHARTQPPFHQNAVRGKTVMRGGGQITSDQWGSPSSPPPSLKFFHWAKEGILSAFQAVVNSWVYNVRGNSSQPRFTTEVNVFCGFCAANARRTGSPSLQLPKQGTLARESKYKLASSSTLPASSPLIYAQTWSQPQSSALLPSISRTSVVRESWLTASCSFACFVLLLLFQLGTRH